VCLLLLLHTHDTHTHIRRLCAPSDWFTPSLVVVNDGQSFGFLECDELVVAQLRLDESPQLRRLERGV